MIPDIQILYLVITAIAGAIVAAVANQLNSGKPFNEAFISTIITVSIAAILTVATGSYESNLTVFDYLFVFLGGAGVNILTTSATTPIAKALRARSKDKAAV